MEGVPPLTLAKACLINPKWDLDVPCIPTMVQTPQGPHKISIRQAQEQVDKVRHYCIALSEGFAILASNVEHKVLTPASDMFNHIAFTDGRSVWYGSGFFVENTRAQAAIVIHEVLHVALRHPQRALAFSEDYGHPHGGENFNPRIWNLAADCIVNLAVKAASSMCDMPKCGGIEFSTLLDDATLKEWPPHRWNLERLYSYLCSQANGGGGGGKGSGKTAGGISNSLSKLKKALDDILNGKANADSLLSDLDALLSRKGAVRKDSPAEARNWGNRVERASAGDKAGGWLRQASFDTQTTETPWQAILRKWITSHVLPTTTVDVLKPSRAMLSLSAYNRSHSGRITPFTPGIQPSKGIKKLIVCVDTSGSINDAILRDFCAEIQTIRNKTGATLCIIAADAKVHEVYEVERHQNLLQAVKQKGLSGGGGTDFRPAIERANKIKDAAVVVYLTDMYDSFPDKSQIPIVWASTSGKEFKPPVGKVVTIMNP